VTPGHVWTIARTELRRRWRTLKGNAFQLLALAVVAVFLLPVLLASLFGAYLLGDLIASGEAETVIKWARMGFVYGWIFVAGLGGYRAYAVALRPDNVDGLLTTVSHRDILGGLVVAELLVWSGFVLTVGFGAAIAFGIGAGSLPSVPIVLLTLCLTLATGLMAGFLLALMIRNTGVRSTLLTRLRTVFLTLLGIAYFALIVTNAFASVLDPLYRLLAPTPISWFGDLAIVGLGVDGSPLRALGAVAFAGVFIAGSVPVLSRLADWLWYADGVHIDHEVEVDHDTERWSRLAGHLPVPIVGVILADWKRARRSPLSLSFALYPLFVLIGPIMTMLETGAVSTGLPLWILLCGTWITGSLFALNVIGHEGAALPVTLLADSPSRALIGGHVLAGVIPLVPVTIGATLLTALLSPYPLPMVVSLTVAASVLSVAAGGIATGIGVAFPRFEAVRVSRSRKAIVPSTVAFIGYSLVVACVSLPAMIGHSATVGHALASVLHLDQFVIAVGGTVVSTILAVGVGAISTTVANRRLDGYRLG
jgi:uncharacterized membrane protein